MFFFIELYTLFLRISINDNIRVENPVSTYINVINSKSFFIQIMKN